MTMNQTLPLMANPRALTKLGNLYIGAFWLGWALFYLTLAGAGYRPEIALLTLTAAGIGCLLLRRADRVAQPAPPLTAVAVSRAALSPGAGLALCLDDLIHEARSLQRQVGVMLITVYGAQGNSKAPSRIVMDLVRGALYRAADSRVFPIDPRTFAVAECRDDVSSHLEDLAGGLRTEVAARRNGSEEFRSARLAVGVAVAEHNRASTGELLANARVAARLSEAKGIDISSLDV